MLNKNNLFKNFFSEIYSAVGKGGDALGKLSGTAIEGEAEGKAGMSD